VRAATTNTDRGDLAQAGVGFGRRNDRNTAGTVGSAEELVALGDGSGAGITDVVLNMPTLVDWYSCQLRCWPVAIP
jgi:hypothetical protein